MRVLDVEWKHHMEVWFRNMSRNRQNIAGISGASILSLWFD